MHRVAPHSRPCILPTDEPWGGTRAPARPAASGGRRRALRSGNVSRVRRVRQPLDPHAGATLVSSHPRRGHRCEGSLSQAWADRSLHRSPMSRLSSVVAILLVRALRLGALPTLAHLVIGLSRTDGVPSRPVVGPVTVGGRDYPDHRGTVRVTTNVGLTVGQGIECCRPEFRS